MTARIDGQKDKIMKNEEKSSTETQTLLAALTGRLAVEDAREAAEERRANLTDNERSFVGALEFDKPCTVCRGSGYIESQENSDAPAYTVTTPQREFKGGSLVPVAAAPRVTLVEAPKVTVRVAHEGCGGRGRILNALGRAFFESVTRVLRDEIKPEAASVDEFNVAARRRLAVMAKQHEAQRERHEAAAKIERDAADKAAAIRGGHAHGAAQDEVQS